MGMYSVLDGIHRSLCFILFLEHRLYETPEYSDVQFWSNLLSISTRFFFDKIRERAIRMLSLSATPVDKLYLAQKYDIPQWVQQARKRLCERSRPLEIWEAERIGWDTAILLAKAREILRDSSQLEPDQPPSRSPSPPGSIASLASSVIHRISTPSPSYGDWRVSWAVNQSFGEAKTDGGSDPGADSH
jgi:hypothetical protein